MRFLNYVIRQVDSTSDVFVHDSVICVLLDALMINHRSLVIDILSFLNRLLIMDFVKMRPIIRTYGKLITRSIRNLPWTDITIQGKKLSINISLSQSYDLNDVDTENNKEYVQMIKEVTLKEGY